MGAPIKAINLPEGTIIINFVDNKIWAFKPSSPQFEGAYVAGNVYNAAPVASSPAPTPAPAPVVHSSQVVGFISAN